MEKMQQISNFFKIYGAYVGQFIMATLEMQLFLSCMYIPILSYWGLSWPLLSIVSTPLFIPVFIAFLVVSSLIFLNSLFSSTIFPFFVTLLELITKFWLFLLSMPPFQYQLGFCLPPLFFLFLLPCAGLYVISLSHSRGYKVFYLSATILLFYGFTVLFGLTKPSCQRIETDRGYFYLISCNGKNIILDTGGWKKAVPYPSWFFYTLIPEITKLSGATNIDIWIVISTKKNFSRFVDAVCLISPHASIVTHEKNYVQCDCNDYKVALNCFQKRFVIDQIEFLFDKRSLAIIFQEKVVFRSTIT